MSNERFTPFGHRRFPATCIRLITGTVLERALGRDSQLYYSHYIFIIPSATESNRSYSTTPIRYHLNSPHDVDCTGRAMLPSSIFGSSGTTLDTGGVQHFLRFIWFRISLQRLGQLGRRSNIDGNTRNHKFLCRLRTTGLGASTQPPRYERVTHYVDCKSGTGQHPSRGVGGFSFFSFRVYVMDIKRAGFGKREISCAYRMGLHFPRYFGPI